MKDTRTMRVIDSILIILVMLFNCGKSIESPEYSVVLHLDADIEIRLYEESLWIAATVENATSFVNTTRDGFHRVYQYIHGANLNSTQITKAAPVLTTFVPSSHAYVAYVKYYLPETRQAAPPSPAPELHLQFERWNAQCLAIRKFSGFAKDDSITKEIDALVAIMSKIGTGKMQNVKDNASVYAIAQYNASFHLSGRLNEVWMNVSGFGFEGCPSC